RVEQSRHQFHRAEVAHGRRSREPRPGDPRSAPEHRSDDRAPGGVGGEHADPVDADDADHEVEIENENENDGQADNHQARRAVMIAWGARAARMTCLAACGLLAASAPSAAQGNGHGNAYGHFKSTVSAPAAAAPAGSAQIPGTGVRNFGSWLDDASVMDPGTGYVSFGLGIWKTPVYREIDLPTVDSG